MYMYLIYLVYSYNTPDLRNYSARWREQSTSEYIHDKMFICIFYSTSLYCYYFSFLSHYYSCICCMYECFCKNGTLIVNNTCVSHSFTRDWTFFALFSFNCGWWEERFSFVTKLVKDILEQHCFVVIMRVVKFIIQCVLDEFREEFVIILVEL